MAYGLNKVMLIGNIGSDLELKYTGSSVAVLNFSLATNESYKNQEGQLVEKTEWHKIVAFRKPAEIIQQFAKKGSKLFVEGKLQTRNYEDKNGVKHYVTEIVVDDFMFLDSRGGNGGGGGQQSSADSTPKGGAAEEQKEDDLPF